MMSSYQLANLELIAKSISELHFEEILTNLCEQNPNHFSICFKSGVKYLFEGSLSLWQTLQINPLSLKRLIEKNNTREETENLSAGQFFLDIQHEIGINDITMAHFLEEMHNTLYSECKILEKIKNLSIDQIEKIPFDQLQFFLSGHPKILLNKGRMGFGVKALDNYAPENEKTMQFMWLLVHKDLPIFSSNTFEKSLDQNYFYQNVFSENENHEITHFLNTHFLNSEDYTLFPVHPWQFDRFIAIQYASYIDNKTIIPFKTAGAMYRPQISLRTFFNADNEKSCDIKVSLTVLNTSAYRGIGALGIETSHELSSYLSMIIEKDQFFHDHPTHVLKEIAAASIVHPYFSKIQSPPYRYNEMLGYIVRESHHHYLKQDESALMSGAFFLKDKLGKSLIAEYIKRSNIEADKWIEAYTRNVILPLYHLQLSHGVGIVAHGQNIVVKFKNFLPTGVFLKDFQGDLRFSQSIKDNLPEGLSKIKTLPADYLIHDLLTGHFITVWRFISPLLQAEEVISEEKTYAIMGNVIEEYLKKYWPEIYHNHGHPLNLLRTKIEKIILNKVRFTIGYQDSDERPVPLTGTALKNPLAQTRDII